jgi:hypothetical protein
LGIPDGVDGGHPWLESRSVGSQGGDRFDTPIRGETCICSLYQMIDRMNMLVYLSKLPIVNKRKDCWCASGKSRNGLSHAVV